MSALSTTAREFLVGLGVEVYDVRDGVVYMGDRSGGSYDPASIVAVESACETAAAQEFHDDEDRTAKAYCFAAFHSALAEAS